MKRGTDQDLVAVIGAGVMGTSIAALALGHGMSVVLTDVNPLQLERASRQVDVYLRHGRLLAKFPSNMKPGKLKTATEINWTVTPVAVIEAITENSDLKREALRRICAQTEEGTPLISNTSGIPIKELARGLQRPQDIVGVHFMNPAYLIKMVEVVRGSDTVSATMDAVGALMGKLDREFVVVNDSPGFVTSRLLHPFLNEAARIVDEGVASAETVDTLMTGCLGHPIGPLRTADLIGLDNLVDSLAAINERTGQDHFKPCSLLLDKVKKGYLGHKAGRGFFEYGEVIE